MAKPKRHLWRVELIPIGMLLLVFVVQRVNIHMNALTPWMGGGFSMFTTVDMPHARHVRLYTIDGHQALALGEPDPDALSNALDLPTQRHLRTLASQIEVPEPAVLEVWTIQYHNQRGQVRAHKLASVEIDP